jgi:hypothetical protein
MKQYKVINVLNSEELEIKLNQLQQEYSYFKIEANSNYNNFRTIIVIISIEI